MPLPEQLTRAHVRAQVVGASGRPDIVVTMSGARLVIELKIDAKEGIAQTGRQADDYIGVPDVSFVFLTLGDSPPSDPRFKHLLLRDFYECLRQVLVNSPPPIPLAHVRGRAVAEDYATTLERMLGLDPIDKEAARYWLRYASEIKIAETAAQRLLKYVHEYTERAFADLAPSLGDDVQVVTCTYRVTARWKSSYEERAVLVTRKSWMSDKKAPRLGSGWAYQTSRKPIGPVVGRIDRSGAATQRTSRSVTYCAIICRKYRIRRMEEENNGVRGLGGGISTLSHLMTTMTCLRTTLLTLRTRSASSGSAIGTPWIEPYGQPAVTHNPALDFEMPWVSLLRISALPSSPDDALSCRRQGRVLLTRKYSEVP